MYFDSFSDLISMNGHGGYVWFCFAVALVLIITLFWQPLAKKRQFMKQHSAALRRQTSQQTPKPEGDSNASSS